MKLCIIHLSDIHIRTAQDAFFGKTDKLFEAIKNELNDCEMFLLVLSGDIAFSGEPVQYAAAKNTFNNLFDRLCTYSKLPGHIFVVPGNHDCDFDPEKEAIRSVVLRDIKNTGNTDTEMRRVALEPQESFWQFVKEIAPSQNTENRLCSQTVLKHGDFQLSILALNTAWFSRLKESEGHLVMPTEASLDISSIQPSDLSIAIFHHPRNWLRADDSRSFRTAIEKVADFSFSGHEHTAHAGVFSDFAGNETWSIEAPALQDNSDRSKSGFGIVHIDIVQSKALVITKQWENGNYSNMQRGEWREYSRTASRLKAGLTISTSQTRFLSDCGTGFEHMRFSQDTLRLEDLFVYPNLKEVSPESIKPIENTVRADQAIIKKDESPLLLLITGDEGCGKTALLKTYYSDLFRRGFVPISLSCDEIKDIAYPAIRKLLEKQFNEQYARGGIEFEHIDKGKLTVLIDDFHTFTGQSKSKQLLFQNLKKQVGHLVVFGSRLTIYDSVTSNNLFADFTQLNILEMGPELRHQLVVKWNALGSDIDSRNEILQRNDKAEEFVSNIVRRGLLPAYPVFILSMLQTFDGGEQKAQYTLHGYYYQFMIDKALARAVKQPKNIGFFHMFIKCYCYFLFKERIRFSGVLQSDVRKFYDEHCRKYDVTPMSFNEVTATLVEGKLWRIDGDHIKITYNYVYYFFVAKYLTDYSERGEVQVIVDKMIDRVYREEFANIVTFMVHLEKGNRIVTKLLRKSRDIYVDQSPIELDKDIDFINELTSALPEAVLEFDSVDEARRNELILAEEEEVIERRYIEEEAGRSDYTWDEQISDLDLLSGMIRATRMLAILGQVTKKHWGEMEAEQKLELAEETFAIGLRTLGFYFKLLKDNLPTLVSQVKSILDKKNMGQELSIGEVKPVSDRFIFGLCSLATFGIVRRVSLAIGIEELGETFRRVQDRNDVHSIRLINAAIRLEHYKGFPEDELEQLNDRCKSNYLVQNVIQKLVVNHLYLYHEPEGRKQRLGEKFKISMKSAREIDAKSLIRRTDK